MATGDDRELLRLLRRLGRCQAQINAELAKAKPNHDKIAAAYAAGREFARDADVPHLKEKEIIPMRLDGMKLAKIVSPSYS
jgi:hypothetical protein